jgi:crossover junction endodeoxyribonuclease RuvC
MIVLGIDPGTASTGYGVVSYWKGELSWKDHGCIRTSSRKKHSQRLLEIYNELIKVIEKNSPTVVAIEKIYFNLNVRTAMAVGEARGIAVLAAANYGLPVVEYNPLQVKMALVGYGKAHKKQVQDMVRRVLSLPEIPKPNDAADALAVAICHAHSVGYLKEVER